jgi:hypothetical protein
MKGKLPTNRGSMKGKLPTNRGSIKDKLPTKSGPKKVGPQRLPSTSCQQRAREAAAVVLLASGRPPA